MVTWKGETVQNREAGEMGSRRNGKAGAMMIKVVVSDDSKSNSSRVAI